MELKYVKKEVRAAAILTTSYVAGTVVGDPASGFGRFVDPVDNNQFVALIQFTKGSLTSAEIKIEFSDDGTTYYQETNASISAGTTTETLAEHTITASGNYKIALPIADKYIKVSVKGTGTVTSSSMTVDAVLAIR